jgi:hypothetical protein
MPWLVQGELAAAWEPQRRDEAPARVGDLVCEPGPFCTQRLDGGADVVAHQVELVAHLPISGMRSEFGWREAEDQPSSARIDRAQAEHVPEESPVCSTSRVKMIAWTPVITARQPIGRRQLR